MLYTPFLQESLQLFWITITDNFMNVFNGVTSPCVFSLLLGSLYSSYIVPTFKSRDFFKCSCYGKRRQNIVVVCACISLEVKTDKADKDTDD